jgi:hypothetical protein
MVVLGAVIYFTENSVDETATQFTVVIPDVAVQEGVKGIVIKDGIEILA